MKKVENILIIVLLTHSITCGQNNFIEWKDLTNLSEGTEIAVGTFTNGEINKHGFIIEKNKLQKKVNSKSLFEIGSITKVFTTLSTLKILKNKQIDLKQPVAKHLPTEAKHTSNKITFEKLMTHTSGIPKMPKNFLWSTVKCTSDPFLHYCEKRVMRFLNNFKPKDEEEFLYSNLGMGLLGHLCSILENSSLEQIMKAEIFEPLKMTSTTLGISKEQYTSVVNSKGIRQKPKRTWEFSDITKGAGNAYSNLDDMTQLLKFILATKDSSNEIHTSILEMEKEQVSISETEGIGLGWRIHKNRSKIIYHGGITYGFKSLIAYNRNQQKGIVILTNAKGFSRKENKILKDLCVTYLENNETADNKIDVSLNHD